MQIDAHHAATYVAARAAGFGDGEAATIAYAAQYVDDATNAGAILFENSAYLYARIASAHRMIDYHNVVEVANHLAWLPFHFLPGNGGLPAGAEPAEGELAKLACRADSPVARDMLRAALGDRGSPRALYRLGIAMHVYADTFSHDGFVGAISAANRVSRLQSRDPQAGWRIEATTWADAWRELRAVPAGIKAVAMLFVVSLVQAARECKWPVQFWSDLVRRTPLGHTAADAFPDQPYLLWRYVDWRRTPIERDNPARYLAAVDMMTRALRAWRAGDATMALERHDGLAPADAAAVEVLFRTLDDPEGEARHGSWLMAIAEGKFSFGKATPRYVAKGKGSWKEMALGTTAAKDAPLARYRYTPAFLASDWKLFHDALQAHRHDVIHDILPRYGICAA